MLPMLSEQHHITIVDPSQMPPEGGLYKKAKFKTLDFT